MIVAIVGDVERAPLLAMIASCERAGVRLMIHENWRFRPWYRALRAAIDEGVIGRPIRLRLVHRDTRALRPDGFDDQPYFTTMPRLILADEHGEIIDGDQILALIARSWFKDDRLAGNGIVATVMSNLGLQHFLRDLGLAVAEPLA